MFKPTIITKGEGTYQRGAFKDVNFPVVTRIEDHQETPGYPQGQRHHHTKSGVIYMYKCDRVEYDKEYIGESTRTSVKGL